MPNLPTGGFDPYRCPMCIADIALGWDYCGACGVLIDWSHEWMDDGMCRCGKSAHNCEDLQAKLSLALANTTGAPHK